MMKVQRVSIFTIAVFLLLALVALSSSNQQGSTFFVSAQEDDKKEDKEDKDDGDDDDDDDDDDELDEPVTISPPGGNITATMPEPDMGNSTMMEPDEDVCTCDMDNMISCIDPKGESMCMCDMDGVVVCDDSDEPPQKDEDPAMEDPSIDVPAMEDPAIDVPAMEDPAMEVPEDTTDAPVATPVIVSPTPASVDDSNTTESVPVVSGSAKTNGAVVAVAISALAGLVALN